MPRRTAALGLVVLLVAALGIFGQPPAPPAPLPPAPPPPAVYQVRVRYRITAFGVERIGQHVDMLADLKRLGFVRSPDEPLDERESEDPKLDRLNGTVKAADARRLLLVRHVEAIELLPEGAKVVEDRPEDKAAPVRVSLELTSGLVPARQRLLHEQTAGVLKGIGFVEGVAYDTRGYTRLLGSIPRGQRKALLDDLRTLPGADRVPAPFASVVPVRVSELQPGMELPKARPPLPVVDSALQKLSPELRPLAADPAEKDKVRRFEVVLALTPPADDRTWLERLQAAVPGVSIEGRLGPLVTVSGPTSAVLAAAQAEDVTEVRLPRLARTDLLPALEKERDFARALLAPPPKAAPGVPCSPTVRHAVVEADFRGWEALRGKGLPETTRLVDLTRARNATLLPDPFPGDEREIGAGTRFALAMAKINPAVDLTLIRVDPAAPYMIEEAAQAIVGDPYRSLSLQRRNAELEITKTLLDGRKDRLLAERRVFLSDFAEDEAALKRKQDYLQAQAQYDRDEREYYARLNRLADYQRDLRNLRGTRIVVSGAVWNEGYPVNGSSPLSRYFDDRPFRGALWYQAVGDPRPQTWAGLFRDLDGNNVMEFAGPETPLPPGTWTRELNFLEYRKRDNTPLADLPEKTPLRLTLQWREAHDPDYLRVGQDLYRQSLADLRIVLLYQPDPQGAKRPADDFEVVAQSAGPALRLEATPGSGTYEVVLLAELPKPGRYAVRIEGKAPEGILPRGAVSLPGQKRAGELRPRLFVETLAGDGRAVFRDFVAEEPQPGMPGDARRVLPVGPEREK